MRLKNSKLKFHRAFTLVEMMVVIVLIAIVAAAIIPEMKGTFGDALLRSTGRDLVNVFSLASSRAVGLGQCYRVKFDIPARHYAVERQIHDGPGTDFVPLKDVSGAEGKLDSHIAIAINPPDESSSPNELSPSTADQGLSDAISFYPDGTADAAEIRLSDRDGFQLLMKLNPVTARVHITEPRHE